MPGLPRGNIKNILKPVWHDQSGRMPSRKLLWSRAGVPLHPSTTAVPMVEQEDAPFPECTTLPPQAHCPPSRYPRFSSPSFHVWPLPRLSLQGQGGLLSALVHHSYPGSPPQMLFACLHVWSSSRISLKPEAVSFSSLHFPYLAPCLPCHNMGSLSETGPMTQLCAVRS